jgi:hypothetical protein
MKRVIPVIGTVTLIAPVISFRGFHGFHGFRSDQRSWPLVAASGMGG